MNSTSLLVDSNILIYAINNSSPKQKAAQTFLQTNSGRLVVTHQNIFESLRILTHKKFPNPMTPLSAVQAITAITDHCQIALPNQTTHHIAMAFMQKHHLTGDKIFDAYLVATALSAEITIIATDNTKDFIAYDQVTVINPFISE